MFDPNDYGAVFAPLLVEERLNELGPGHPSRRMGEILRTLDLAQAFAPSGIQDRRLAQSCLAGLWLYHDYLDESHHISQNTPGATGSYWHSLMHRREPDSWNSKYWLDRTRQHPIFPELCESARAIARKYEASDETRFLLEQRLWDPYRFVDLCEAARTGTVNAELLCRQIQLEEWRLLFDFCYRGAQAE